MFDDEWRPNVDAFIIDTTEEIAKLIDTSQFGRESSEKQNCNNSQSKRQRLSYIMQHLKNMSKTLLDNTLEHFQDTVNLNNGFSLDQEFEELIEEFDEIKARSVSVLTSSIVTLLT